MAVKVNRTSQRRSPPRPHRWFVFTFSQHIQYLVATVGNKKSPPDRAKEAAQGSLEHAHEFMDETTCVAKVDGGIIGTDVSWNMTRGVTIDICASRAECFRIWTRHKVCPLTANCADSWELIGVVESFAHGWTLTEQSSEDPLTSTVGGPQRVVKKCPCAGFSKPPMRDTVERRRRVTVEAWLVDGRSGTHQIGGIHHRWRPPMSVDLAVWWW
jgi:hypothetical protein